MIHELTSFICAQSWRLRRSTAVEIPTAGAGASHSPRHHSLVAGLLQCKCAHFRNSLAFRYRGEPLLMTAKPLIFKAARAFLQAIIQGLVLPRALAFLLTILPALFRVRSFAVRPPTVFALLPRSTIALAMRPFAILLTDFFFMAFMAFIAFAIAGRRIWFRDAHVKW